MRKLKVYKVDLDVNRYQHITFESVKRGRLPRIEFDGRRRRDGWKKTTLWIPNPRSEVPAFFDLAGPPGAFVVPPNTYMQVGEFLEMSAELLPAEYQGEQWFVVNIIECPDCLDNNKTDWGDQPQGERFMPPDRYVFNRHLVPGPPEPHLFKIPELPYQFFVSEFYGDPDSEFKAACEKHRLKGIKFELVWTA